MMRVMLHELAHTMHCEYVHNKNHGQHFYRLERFLMHVATEQGLYMPQNKQWRQISGLRSHTATFVAVQPEEKTRRSRQKCIGPRRCSCVG